MSSFYNNVMYKIKEIKFFFEVKLENAYIKNNMKRSLYAPFINFVYFLLSDDNFSEFREITKTFQNSGIKIYLTFHEKMIRLFKAFGLILIGCMVPYASGYIAKIFSKSNINVVVLSILISSFIYCMIIFTYLLDRLTCERIITINIDDDDF